MLRFSLSLILTALIFAGALIINGHYSIFLQPSFAWESLILLFIATLIIYFYLVRVSKSIFVQLYLLTIALKIIAYASFLVVIVLKNRADALINVLFFLVVYVVFSILEITFLYRKVSGSS